MSTSITTQVTLSRRNQHCSEASEAAIQPVADTRRQSPGKGMKRIVYLVETLEVGGTEKQAVEAALQLHSKGHQVTVACLQAKGPLLDVLRRSGIPVIEFARGRKLFSFHGLHQLLRLTGFLRRERFDVLHAHDLPSNLVGVPAGWLARTPIIISSRRYLADLDWCSPWKNTIIGMIYRWSTCVVVNSVTIRDLLINRHGLRADKMRVIYNGIDADRFCEAQPDETELLAERRNGSKLIAIVANMHCRIKGHACLVSAAQTICRAFPQAKFVLIGEGQERPVLEQQVQAAGLESNFLFLGARRDVPELLACCDISVL